MVKAAAEQAEAAAGAAAGASGPVAACEDEKMEPSPPVGGAAGGAAWPPPQGACVRAVAGPMAGRTGRVRCSGTEMAQVYFDQEGRGGRASAKPKSVAVNLADIVHVEG